MPTVKTMILKLMSIFFRESFFCFVLHVCCMLIPVERAGERVFLFLLFFYSRRCGAEVDELVFSQKRLSTAKTPVFTFPLVTVKKPQSGSAVCRNSLDLRAPSNVRQQAKTSSGFELCIRRTASIRTGIVCCIR